MRWWAKCDEMARRSKVTRTSGTDARGLMVRLRDTRSACCPISTLIDASLAPDVALLLPDGTLDYWSNDLLDLVPLA